jgi:ribonuclease P protein component
LNRKFQKKNRLGQNTSKTIQLGKKVRTDNVIVYYHTEENPKLAIIAGKKVGNSVERNKLKKWTREIFRNMKIQLKDYGIVVVYKTGSAEYTYEQVKEILCELWKKANLL